MASRWLHLRCAAAHDDNLAYEPQIILGLMVVLNCVSDATSISSAVFMIFAMAWLYRARTLDRLGSVVVAYWALICYATVIMVFRAVRQVSAVPLQC